MKKIMIDAGHGPETAGKRSPDGTLREFMFNEAVAIRLRKLLSTEGYTVVFSHNHTCDIALSERIWFATIQTWMLLFRSMRMRLVPAGMMLMESKRIQACVRAKLP